MYSETMEYLKSYDEFQDTISSLKSSGWETIESNDPERGIRGYLATRVVDGVEEHTSINWLPQGFEFTPTFSLVNQIGRAHV